MVNTVPLQHVHVCMCNSGNVNAFEWDCECFFFRHVDLNSKFIVMTTDEVTLNRPEIGTGISVICWFCRLRLAQLTLKFFSEILTRYKVILP